MWKFVFRKIVTKKNSFLAYKQNNFKNAQDLLQNRAYKTSTYCINFQHKNLQCVYFWTMILCLQTYQKTRQPCIGFIFYQARFTFNGQGVSETTIDCVTLMALMNLSL